MAKNDLNLIDGDSRNPFERYQGSYDDFYQFKEIEKKVTSGYFHELPQIAQNEAKIITGKRRIKKGKLEVYDFDKDLVDSLGKERPDNLPALYPSIKAGLQRRANEFQKYGSNLESIINSTPDKVLNGLLGLINPVDGLPGKYNKIAKLHGEVKYLGELRKMYNEDKDKNGEHIGEGNKKKVLENIREVVADYYKSDLAYVTLSKDGKTSKVKEGSEAAFSLIMETLKYSDAFALMRFEKIYSQKAKEFEKAMKEDSSGYVKASLKKLSGLKEDKKKGIPDGKQYVSGLYEQLFSQKYQNKE